MCLVLPGSRPARSGSWDAAWHPGHLEVLMRRRLLGVLVGTLALVVAPALAYAQGAAPKGGDKAAAQTPKAQQAQGAVTAVTTDSLTVKAKTGDMTFSIDKTTSVTAKGATHKSLANKADGKASVLTDFVKVGDQVTVTYHEQGATKHAASIRVTSPTK